MKDDQVYLCSSVVAAASALTGVITDPRTLGAQPAAALPPASRPRHVGFVQPDGGGEILRGPNIKPVPLGEPVAEAWRAPVLLKLGDKVSTDDISPAGSARVLVFRSNVPAIAEFCFKYVDAGVRGAREGGGGARHHRGRRDVRSGLVARSGGHRAHASRRARRDREVLRPGSTGRTLINWGVVPLVFDDPAAFAGIERDDRLRLPGLRSRLAAGERITIANARTGATFTATCALTRASARYCWPAAFSPTRADGRDEGGVSEPEKIRAVYMRGGTSRCLVFHHGDLPAPGPARDQVLLTALGSP